jgi:hypothetical protein
MSNDRKRIEACGWVHQLSMYEVDVYVGDPTHINPYMLFTWGKTRSAVLILNEHTGQLVSWNTQNTFRWNHARIPQEHKDAIMVAIRLMRGI